MLQQIIERAWDDRSQLENNHTQQAIKEVIEQLDQGTLRVAEPVDDGWKINEWIKINFTVNKLLFYLFHH